MKAKITWGVIAELSRLFGIPPSSLLEPQCGAKATEEMIRTVAWAQKCVKDMKELCLKH